MDQAFSAVCSNRSPCNGDETVEQGDKFDLTRNTGFEEYILQVRLGRAFRNPEYTGSLCDGASDQDLVCEACLRRCEFERSGNRIKVDECSRAISIDEYGRERLRNQTRADVSARERQDMSHCRMTVLTPQGYTDTVGPDVGFVLLCRRYGTQQLRCRRFVGATQPPIL